MGTSRRSWFAIVRERFARPSPRETIIVLHTNNTITASFSEEDATTREEDLNTQIIQLGNPIAVSSSSTQKEFLSEERIAAIKVQAHFRGKKGISSPEVSCEATSYSSWGVREKTGSYSFALHACSCPVTSQCSGTAAPEQV
ncbi:unnamed protein product [Ilex paraguariensis]|uniref:Uncharacterized protein n=1 Tax=Ilex paraguariensis TaxID=185542 RepID=A0ABC8UPA5_9AQUA